MDELFVRPDDKPMQFYLADLDIKEKTKYTLLIEDAGGRVEKNPSDNVLIFTVNSDEVNKYDFVFDVKFIDDCIAKQEILDIELYYLGDERFKSCEMCKFTMGLSRCLCSTAKCSDIFELVRELEKNKKTAKFGSLKLTKSDDKQESKQTGVSCSQKNATQQGNIEISKKLRQTTLKSTVLDKNDIQHKQTKRDYVEDTDNETEINSSPVLNKRFVQPRPEIKENKFLKKRREEVELSKPSTSKVIPNKDIKLKKIVISSNEDEGRSQKNSRKTTEKKKVFTKEKSGSKKIGYVEYQSVSEEEIANSQEEAVSQELADFIEKTRKDKILDYLGYPVSESKDFEEWESRAIIDYLIISDRVHQASDPKTWKAIQSLKFLPQKRGLKVTYQHFIRSILPNIDSYNLSPKDLEQFKTLNL